MRGDRSPRAALLPAARDALAHARAGTLRTEPAIMELDAGLYTDPGRFEREQRLLFRRVPLMLAASCELREPGQFKTLEVAGVPVLLSRGDDGQARAFLNVCTHRGAVLADGCGHAPRFVCPYHGWTFNAQGALVGVAAKRDFGEFDLTERALRQFPLLERAGLIWVVLDPESTLDIERFLSPFGAMLEAFGFHSWHFLQSRTLKGANWKLAFDAHLEFYHLPVLHRNTFGPKIGNRALYHYFGPHQRLIRPAARESRNLSDPMDLFSYQDRPETEWPTEALLLGEWIAFPNVSINSFYDGGRGVLISQVFPGERVDESYTVQAYLTAEPPDDASRAAAAALCDFLGHVVNDEDLATSIRQQRALASGLLPTVCIGRNEGGLQHFHRWIDRILDTPEHDLNGLFSDAARALPATS